MDFFNHQDQARSSTRMLVLLFCCAVAALIVIASVLVYGVLLYSGNAQDGTGLDQALFSDVFLKVAIGVIAVVALGSLFRLAQLRGGGKVVAESMQGRLINLNTRDPDERKVLNVVEEMAIASGIPVPPVYLIEDPAINAFAAGYRQEDAVIGVTRGCIEQLDRDELQGVIAHEFSHIFHGDMRINIRLIGVLYGIMVIGLIGYFLMRGGAYSSIASRSRGRNASGLVLAGLGLVVIGYGGTFFGNLIKAAVSRHREFLADASAVQYTRNPEGIANALKKIGGLEAGSRLSTVNAAEYSHMLFEEGVNAGFRGLLATHPPLEERIRRLDPTWQGGKKGKAGPAAPRGEGGAQGAVGAAAFSGAASFSGGSDATGSALESIGEPGPAHIALARELLARIPPELLEAAHSSLGACSLGYALLIDARDAALAGRQLHILEAELSPRHFAMLKRTLDSLRQLPRELHLPLLDLAMPGLRELSAEQYRRFMGHLRRLIMEDSKVSLFEWSLYRILRANLEPPPRLKGANLDIAGARSEFEVLLSALAAAGHDDAGERAEAYRQAFDGLDRLKGAAGEAGRIPDLAELDKALDRLRLLKPLQKPMLLKAMVRCIDADGRVRPAEAELLRAVAALLDCPVPPLLGGQKFA